MNTYTKKIAQNRFGLMISIFDIIFKRKKKNNNKELIFLCKCHGYNKISEREFYSDIYGIWSGIKIICKKCGKNKFIKDKNRPS